MLLCFSFRVDRGLHVGVDEGESVFVDGVKDVTLRSQLAAFLTALGLADPAGRGDKLQGFRCSGGGVLQGVADLMDERDLADVPPLDREAAFEAAKEVRKRGKQQLNGRKRARYTTSRTTNLRVCIMCKQESDQWSPLADCEV